jgi:hypothetical protein
MREQGILSSVPDMESLRVVAPAVVRSRRRLRAVEEVAAYLEEV